VNLRLGWQTGSTTAIQIRLYVVTTVVKNITDTLFFDGSCPLCRREVAVLNKIKFESLHLVDIHHLDRRSSDDIPDDETLLRTLHLQTADGEFLKGLDATVKSWSHTPYGWVFKPLHWPVIRPIASHIYKIWAARRFERIYGCSKLEVNP